MGAEPTIPRVRTGGRQLVDPLSADRRESVSDAVLQQLVLRAPFNIRPFLGITPHESAIGRGYMAWGYVVMCRPRGVAGGPRGSQALPRLADREPRRWPPGFLLGRSVRLRHPRWTASAGRTAAHLERTHRPGLSRSVRRTSRPSLPSRCRKCRRLDAQTAVGADRHGELPELRRLPPIIHPQFQRDGRGVSGAARGDDRRQPHARYGA